MDPIVACAERILRRSPHPALKLSELREAVADLVDRTLDAKRLRAVLERHPERFRVLEPSRGPWRSVPESGRSGAPARIEPWVVAVGDPEPPPDGAGPTALKLRESVRWLGRGVDTRSPAEVSRWYAIAMSEREVRRAVVRRAA